MPGMLCCVSKQEEPSSSVPRIQVEDGENGAAGPPNIKTDPRIGLTTRQIFILTKNWKGISRKMEETGVNMFLRMFEKNSELYDVFGKLSHLRGLPREKQAANEMLENHAVSVMNVFDEAIGKIGKPDDFFLFLHKYGKVHGSKPGFHAELFWQMEEPFLFALKLTLEDRYTENMEDIYTRVIKLIIGTLVEACPKKAADTGDVTVTVS